jgi:hypothetical protein
MTDKVAALQALTPAAQWVLRGDELEWLDEVQTQPTDSEIAAKVIELQTQYDSQEYARSRKVEYNKLNQDEMRYDDLVNSTTTWQDAIAAIKVAIPKG